MNPLEALMMPVAEDEQMKALARSLRGRQTAAEFFSASSIPQLQQMAQTEQKYIQDVGERQGVLREALERRKQDQSQFDEMKVLRQAGLENERRQLAQTAEYQRQMGQNRDDMMAFRYGVQADKAAEKEVKKTRALDMMQGKVLNMNDISQKALGLINPHTTGVIGKVASAVPGTDRKSLEGYLDTLKSNLSFDRLQEMRDNSLTGGALGNVSNVELQLLGSTVSSLNPDQDPAVLAENIQSVQNHFNDMMKKLWGDDYQPTATDDAMGAVELDPELKAEAEAAIAAGADPAAVWAEVERMQSGE